MKRLGGHDRLPSVDAPLRSSGCAVVKLGGSLITSDNKGHPVTNRALITACAQDLVNSSMPIVLVHGTGSYGKPPAIRYNYLDGRLGRDRSEVVSRVAIDLARLELDVLECLQMGGMRPMRLSPLTLFHSEGSHVTPENIGWVAALLSRGITPVIGGNFIIDTNGFSVCSSDIMAVELAIALKATVLIFATNARGVYQKFGQGNAIFKSLSQNDYNKLSMINEDRNDVSGGIKTKVATGFQAAKHGIPTFIIDGRMAENLSSSIMCNPKAGTRLVCDGLKLLA